MRRRARRGLAGAGWGVMFALLLGATVPGTEAHTYLTRSIPADGSTMPMPVEEVRLFFNTPVQRALSSVTVTDPDGFSVPAGNVVPVPDADEDEFRVIFRTPLPEGRYEVRWRTVGPDDHPVQGTFSFSVAPAAQQDQLGIAEDTVTQEEPDSPAAHEARPDPHVDPGATGFMAGENARLQLTVRWLFYLAIIGMIGTVVFRVGVVRPLSRPVEFHEVGARALRRTRNLAWIMGVLALVVLLPRLLLQTWAIFGSLMPGHLSTVIFQTTWGLSWLLQAFFSLVFVAGLVAAGEGGRNARGWGVMTLAAVGMAFIPALSGHAWGAEAMRTTVILSTFVHVLAGGIWLGGLLTLLFAGLPSLRRGTLEPGGEEGVRKEKAGYVGLSSMVNAFSRVVIFAVGLLVITGFISAWVHLDSLRDLVATGYGRTLLVKIGVALGAFALGFYNWKVVRPALEDRQEAGILRIPASLELFIGFLVLVVTAVLVSQALP